LSQRYRDDLIFFGGTALSRTHLKDSRLSEDIDLIAIVERDDLALRLARDIGAALARTHGRIRWTPPWSSTDVESAVAVTPTGVAIKIQLLRNVGYQPWPTEVCQIEQRYQDAPSATLRVPTLPAFVGWKTAAWLDRQAPRDLYDLWALARIGALTGEAAALFARYGPTNEAPRPWMFRTPPPAAQWHAQLAAQTRLTVTAEEAINVVRSAWEDACRAG
jgi:hypothetical protein